MASNTPSRSALRLQVSFAAFPRLLRPRLTSRSGSTPSPFRAQGEISPGKNALLHCTAAGSTPLPIDHESFAVSGPLALVGNAFYPVLVHQPAASLYASSPQSVALMQLRFASLVVINSRWDLHPQECAHAGRTKEKGRRVSPTAFPVLRQLHINGRFQNLRTRGLSPGRVLLGSRCKSGQSRLEPEPTRWSPISVR